MSPHVTLPNDFVDGFDTAFGSEVKANDDAIVGVVNGGLDYQNVAPLPDFPGSIISSTPGRRLDATRFENDAVDGRVLKDDSSSGSAAAGVNLSDHIKDGIVLRKKLKWTNQTLTFAAAAQVLVSGEVHTVTYNYNITNTFPIAAFLVLASQTDPDAGANPCPPITMDIAPVAGNTWRVRITLRNDIGVTLNFSTVPQVTIVFLAD